MQPLGRKSIQSHGAKMHYKINGKYAEAWWEGLGWENKKGDRQTVKRLIKKEQW